MIDPQYNPDQILRDLDRHNDDKLKQWFADAHARYTMIDVSDKIAFVHTLTVLLMAAAHAMNHIGVTPEEAAEQIASAVAALQKVQQKAN